MSFLFLNNLAYLEFINLEVIYHEVFCAMIELLKCIYSRENATDEMMLLGHRDNEKRFSHCEWFSAKFTV